MAEISRMLDFFSKIELLLKEEKYQDAHALLTQRLKQNPRDRASGLYLLLVNVTLHGLGPYEEEIQRLQSVSEFSDAEKEIVRRLFLLAFTTAEKEGKERQAWVYQRLLRRLLINQPPDHSVSQTSLTAPTAQPTDEAQASELEDSGVVKRVESMEKLPASVVLSQSRWASRLSRAWSTKSRANPSMRIMLLSAAVGFLIAPVLYFLLIHSQSVNNLANRPTTMPPPPKVDDNVLVREKIVLSGLTGGGTIKTEAIQKMVLDQLPSLQQTYHKWAQENRNLMGSLVVRIKLDAAGNVAKVEGVASRIADAKFRNAALDQLRRWKFTKANVGATEFTLSLLFVPQGMDPGGIARWERTLGAAIASAKAAPENVAKKPEDAGVHMIPWNFVLLLLAILLWTMSLFLVAEAAKSLKGVVGERVGGPQPSSGVDMSQLLSCFFVLLWLARQLFLAKPTQNPFSFLSELLVNPEQLTPGILLAVFPPLIVGIMKLITALGATREETENQTQQRNQVWVNVVFLSLHVIVGVGATMFLVRSFV